MNTRYKNRLSIFKPDAPLANIVENLGKLGNDLTKRDHVIIVGGPGNGLGKNYCYSFRKEINFTAERSNNMNVRFVNLFTRHYKPWMNRKVRIVYLSLDQALLGCAKSHVHVIDTTLFL